MDNEDPLKSFALGLFRTESMRCRGDLSREERALIDASADAKIQQLRHRLAAAEKAVERLEAQNGKLRSQLSAEEGTDVAGLKRRVVVLEEGARRLLRENDELVRTKAEVRFALEKAQARLETMHGELVKAWAARNDAYIHGIERGRADRDNARFPAADR